MKKIAIVAAKRSAVGRLSGVLSSLSAVRLGEQVAKDTLVSVGVAPAAVDELIAGQVLTAGCGQNPARQVALNIGMAPSSTALTVNQVCGSGLYAVILAAQSISSGRSQIVLAGGQESMSNAPHLQHLRQGLRYGHGKLLDSLLCDGLSDAFDGEPMGLTAERLAEKYSIAKAAQDHFAMRSQRCAQAAIEKGYFASQITPVTVKSPKITEPVTQDEHPRFNINLESIAAQRPAFKANGSVTAANSSGINDGAAYVLLMTLDKAKDFGLTPMAMIDGSGIAGVDPKTMGFGPVPACQKALAATGWAMSDIDLIEANEAFAAQTLAVAQGLGWGDVVMARLNITGGAIALGHPIGASGARILVTLLYNMHRLAVSKGLATLCVGGGQGICLCVSRY